jgi:hypothetical protein
MFHFFPTSEVRISTFFTIVTSINAANTALNSENRGSLYSSQENTFTIDDRERLIRLEVTMNWE